jgi:hypothetical protein
MNLTGRASLDLHGVGLWTGHVTAHGVCLLLGSAAADALGEGEGVEHDDGAGA